MPGCCKTVERLWGLSSRSDALQRAAGCCSCGVDSEEELESGTVTGSTVFTGDGADRACAACAGCECESGGSVGDKILFPLATREGSTGLGSGGEA